VGAAENVGLEMKDLYRPKCRGRNAGLENEGPKNMDGKCRTEKLRTKKTGVENAGPNSAGDIQESSSGVSTAAANAA